MEKLPRAWARASIVLGALFVAFLAAGYLAQLPEMFYPAWAAFLGAFFIKLALLRCPHCGYRGAPPQWRKSGTIHCPRCGHPFEYDR